MAGQGFAQAGRQRRRSSRGRIDGDVYGGRLTDSPQIKAAAEWTQKKLNEWDLVNVHLKKWGPFGRGWSNERFSARVVSSASSFPVIAYPKAWTPGTNGTVEAEVVTAVITNEQDFEKYRGQLHGKYVMTTAMRDVPAEFQAPGRRLRRSVGVDHRRDDV